MTPIKRMPHLYSQSEDWDGARTDRFDWHIDFHWSMNIASAAVSIRSVAVYRET